jgi:branched-subunit amino acid aminotransferase/4-amino-4-deoxychorismate lyase
MNAILNNEKIELDNDIIGLSLYGYACFTAFLVEDGNVKGFQYHIDRLVKDSKEIFGLSPDEQDIRNSVRRFFTSHDGPSNFVVRITVFPKNFSLAEPEKIEMLNILVTGKLHGSVPEKPLRLGTVDAIRALPFQKTTNVISNMKARAIAHKRGFDDALMVSGENITEGATWNIFLGTADLIVTPSLKNGILPGITRKLIIDLGKTLGFEMVETTIPLIMVDTYNYGFITNAACGVAPICSIDDKFGFFSKNKNILLLKKEYNKIQGERVI